MIKGGLLESSSLRVHRGKQKEEVKRREGFGIRLLGVVPQAQTTPFR